MAGNLAYSLAKIINLDLSKERAVVNGAVSERCVEIIPSVHPTAEDALVSAFAGSVLLRDSNVDLVDPMIEAARKLSSEEHLFQNCDETLKKLSIAEKLFKKLNLKPVPSIVVIGSGSLINLAIYVVASLSYDPKLTIIPTNAMSIADVAYGGLGLINASNKNDIRKLRDPDLIFLSSDIFNAAPLTAQKDGQIEVVKHLIFQDTGNNNAQIRQLLDPHETLHAGDLFKSAALGMKLNIILRYAVNAGEKSAKMILNFGHAHAHVIEVLSDYQVHHSEAVRFGMAVDCFGAQAEICNLLKGKVSWSAFLAEAISDLLNRDDENFRGIYERKYISGEAVNCLLPKISQYPYAVKAHQVEIPCLREKIRGVLG